MTMGSEMLEGMQAIGCKVSKEMTQGIVVMTYMVLHHVGAGEAIGVLEERC
jgi:hypothetical protein